MHNHKLLKEKICLEIDNIVAQQAEAETLSAVALLNLNVFYEAKKHLADDIHYHENTENNGTVTMPMSNPGTHAPQNPY